MEKGWQTLGDGNVQKGQEIAVRVLKSARAVFPEADATHEQGLLDALQTPAAVRAIEALLNELNADGAGRRPSAGGEKGESKKAGRIRRLFNNS